MLQRYATLLVPVLAIATLASAGASCARAADPAQLRVPAGFHIAVIANRLDNPRYMAFAPNGDLVIAETGPGRVVAIHPHGNVSQQPITVLDGLELPHGVAFRGDDLYVATWSGVVRLHYPRAANARPATLFADMPQGGDHNRRALALGLDGSIFVSSGSTCNVCVEPDPRYASILHYSAQGTNGKIYASGLRNASGLAFDGNGHLWAVVNERDWLGDDFPPDDLVNVKEGGFYGWPYCNPAGRRKLPDPNMRDPRKCANALPEDFDFQAHSAPLGIVFYSGKQFPQKYRGAAFIAFHGSWNRSVPTGYKVVLVYFSNGKPRAVEDFATGWLHADGSVAGRPAGLAVGPDGSLYVSDDAGGRIYRISYGV